MVVVLILWTCTMSILVLILWNATMCIFMSTWHFLSVGTKISILTTVRNEL